MSDKSASAPRPTVRHHVCHVCQKRIPCTATADSDGGAEEADGGECKLCDTLQVVVAAQDATGGPPVARFFCCEAHMYDSLLADAEL
mgnify:CR=1 FL=1